MGLFSSTSGRSTRRVIIRITVTMPSTIPIMKWCVTIAGNITFKPYGAKGERPTCRPAAIAASTLLNSAQVKIIAYKLMPILGLNSLFSTKKMMQGINTPIMPMFRTFAPSAIRPPSPNSSACRTRIIDIDIRPANGPKIRPIAAPPKMCAVVPPIMGMFMNMAAKKRAVSRPIMGTCFSDSLIFLNEIIQNTMVIIKAGMAKDRGMNPSGRCIVSNLQQQYAYLKCITTCIYKCYQQKK